MLNQLAQANRVSGGVVNLAAALVANAVNVFIISAFAQQIGTKSFKPRKLRVQNVAGGACWLALGTGVGAGFVAMLPPVRVLNNMDNIWQEVELPEVDFFATMTTWVDVLAAGGALNIQVEAEETG